MKRIQEKVKDLIDVRSYEGIQDFLAEPALTLSNYHFTDITSNMMAQWIDRILSIQERRGVASALAGYRGVGKSHFLATIGAIFAHPELRSRISQNHVAASAQRLKRRKYPVVYVRRGTQVDLFDELRAGISQTFDIDAASLSDSLPELLGFAESKAEDLPLIILIDTAHERSSRVARDDGETLSEIAEFAKSSNVFVAVALDDDITGADGANSSIVRSFTIEYLDQEHLYRIVESHIFPKHRQTQALLKEIYTNFKTVLPDFRWSEQRFTSLYPLHPVILEIAPAIRLYAPEFTLLGFASEAGSKIMGRPANSLIALDEVFDTVEESLRKIPDLNQAFEAYDKLSTEVVAHIPVMERHQAKLILKGLMLLSLEGEGTTEGMIRAAMLIYNENKPEKAKTTVEELLKTFVSVMPGNIRQSEEESRETLYSLKVDSKDNLNNALTEASAEVPNDVIPKILRRMARERFFDWVLPEETEGEKTAIDLVESQIVWRGSLRNGFVRWDLLNNAPPESLEQTNEKFLDWEVIINPFEIEKDGQDVQKESELPKAYWQPAPLKKSEVETILRYFVLLTNQELREEYSEQVQAAGYAHTINVERIWNRIFLQDSKFVVNGIAQGFTDEARATQSLSEMLSIMLEPLFDSLYPNHPHFSQTLGMNEVSLLVNDFFSGAKQNVPEVQQLAEFFALPLELVYLEDDVCLLESEEHLTNLSLSKEVLSLIDRDKPDQTVSLEKVYKELNKKPYGLTREAQNLLLTALIAQRQIEFVTTKGDKITRRSLDLKIIWDDIEGIAAPTVLTYSRKRLAEWARILTSSEDFDSIDSPENLKNIRTELANWLVDWKDAKVFERFNELPDEILNTRIWTLATRAEKSFGTTAGIISEITGETLALEDGLIRIADVFSDSAEEFFNRTKDIVILEDFIKGEYLRKNIGNYLAVCETTDVENIENLRDKLRQLIEDSYFDPQDTVNNDLQSNWEVFKTEFTDYFSEKHDSEMKTLLKENYDEIIRSDAWWEFENLARLSVFPQIHQKRVQEVRREFKDLDCKFNVRNMLEIHPFCGCGFSLVKIGERAKLPERLFESVENARESYRRILFLLSQFIIPLIEEFSAKNKDEKYAKAAANLIESLNGGEEIPLLNTEELVILQNVLEAIPESLLLEVNFPKGSEYSKREDLHKKINAWLDALPDKSVLLKA